MRFYSFRSVRWMVDWVQVWLVKPLTGFIWSVVWAFLANQLHVFFGGEFESNAHWSLSITLTSLVGLFSDQRSTPKEHTWMSLLDITEVRAVSLSIPLFVSQTLTDTLFNSTPKNLEEESKNIYQRHPISIKTKKIKSKNYEKLVLEQNIHLGPKKKRRKDTYINQ